ncbi:MAG: transposase [Glaciimonas sp.]|nr:transposase [Glaciimonas sp.]
MFIGTILWILHTVSLWHDLPIEFRNWNSTYVRFSRWSNKDLWQAIFALMCEDGDIKKNQ